jgi:hypothetical protein
MPAAHASPLTPLCYTARQKMLWKKESGTSGCYKLTPARRNVILTTTIVGVMTRDGGNRTEGFQTMGFENESII